MTQHLITYFIQFGQIDIPGAGSLKLIKKEAELSDGIIQAPADLILFEKVNAIPSKQFYSYLSNVLDISNDQASTQFEQFCTSNFSENSRITIGNFGAVVLHNNTYHWESNFDSSRYFKDIDLSGFSNSDLFEEASISKRKDKWWIWAIILGTIALIAILNKI